MMPNPTINLELLIKLMKLTNSATDGEALAALRAANKLLDGNKADWDNLLRGKLAPIDPFKSIAEPKATPTPQPAPRPQPTYQPSPPRQPPPPRQPSPPPIQRYGSTKAEAKDINNWIVFLDMSALGPKTQQDFDRANAAWQRRKSLDKFDYDFLRATYTAVKAKQATP